MEQVPNWLNDAVAAAGIAGVYVDFDKVVPANEDHESPVLPSQPH